MRKEAIARSTSDPPQIASEVGLLDLANLLFLGRRGPGQAAENEKGK